MALGTMPYVAVASPVFAQQYCAKGITPSNFHQLPFIAFNRKDDLQAEFVSQALGLKQVSLRQHFVPSSQGQVSAALAGWGVTVVPEMLVKEALLNGNLVNVSMQNSLNVKLYWHCWNLESDLLEAIGKALQEAAKQAFGR